MRRLPVPLVVCAAFALTAASASAGWQVVPSPNPPGSNYSQLTSAVGTGRNEAWAAGYARVGNNPYRVLVEHFTAGAWTIAPSATIPATDTTFLYGLAATGPRDVWSVGSDNNSSFTVTNGLIEHWNGSSWARSATASGDPGGSTLVAVSADSPTDAWAVGYSNPLRQAYSPLIEHWNGVRWSVVSGAPAYPASNSDRLEAVAALSPTNVWALGVTGRHPDPVFEHFNGTSWSIVPQPAGGYDTFLDAISARASNDIWAVGGTQVTNTLIEHWDGTAWHIVPSPNITGPGSVLNSLTGVSALGAGDVWAVGSSLAGGSVYTTLAEHWNGFSWTIAPTPSPQPSAALNAVASLPGGPLFAVGWGDNSSGVAAPLILGH
jgi:hypothetical protein